MTLTEKFIADAIHLDVGAEIMYGSDQMYDSYPISFPTVEFQLTATDALAELADGIRLEKGCKPIFPRDGSADDVDNDGWYDFYIGISKLPGKNQDCCLDNSISFVVVNSDSNDNEDMYEIPLTESEQECIFEILNRQCRKYHSKDCLTLLTEAEKEMKE